MLDTFDASVLVAGVVLKAQVELPKPFIFSGDLRRPEPHVNPASYADHHYECYAQGATNLAVLRRKGTIAIYRHEYY